MKNRLLLTYSIRLIVSSFILTFLGAFAKINFNNIFATISIWVGLAVLLIGIGCFMLFLVRSAISNR